jgi:hypothetical protein
MVTGDVYDVPPRITNGPEEVILSAHKQEICHGLYRTCQPLCACVCVSEQESERKMACACASVSVSSRFTFSVPSCILEYSHLCPRDVRAHTSRVFWCTQIRQPKKETEEERKEREAERRRLKRARKKVCTEGERKRGPGRGSVACARARARERATREGRRGEGGGREGEWGGGDRGLRARARPAATPLTPREGSRYKAW